MVFKRKKKKTSSETQRPISEADIHYLRQKAEKSLLATFGIIGSKSTDN